ncbi:MAG: energy transducer TonB [Gammaproteobacteria bacterium]|nr:energy transducer TonB [Gammaproteobacteria bacterium]
MRIEGEGVLRILIDRSGQLQQVTLGQSTGNRLLDKAALEMARKANPFPAMPENDPRQSLEFVVPVEFVLH